MNTFIFRLDKLNKWVEMNERVVFVIDAANEDLKCQMSPEAHSRAKYVQPSTKSIGDTNNGCHINYSLFIRNEI